MFVSALSSATAELHKPMDSIKKEPLGVLDYTTAGTISSVSEHLSGDNTRYPANVYPSYEACYTTVAYPPSSHHQNTSHYAISPMVSSSFVNRSCTSQSLTVAPPNRTTLPPSSQSPTGRCQVSPTNITMPADTTTLHTSPLPSDASSDEKSASPTG